MTSTDHDTDQGTDQGTDRAATIRPYGAWPSPIGSDLLVAGAARLETTWAADGSVWWSASRPDEAGRLQVVRRDPDGRTHELLPPGWSARTQVHEYGGGAWCVQAGALFFSAWADQRLYRLAATVEGRQPSGPVPLTAAPPTPRAWRYADGRVTPDGRWLVCVRETHPEPDDPAAVTNELVAVRTDPAGAPDGAGAVLFSGPDFVSAPRISQDGTRLAWTSWNHPAMPWDATTLWVADLVEDGDGLRLAGPRAVAGAEVTGATATSPDAESLVEPQWTSTGELLVVSDRRDGWWNVHRVDLATGALTALHADDAEVAQPGWVFGSSGYAPGTDGAAWLTWSTAEGAWLRRVHPGAEPGVEPGTASRDPLLLPFLSLSDVHVDGDRLVALAFRAETEPAVVAVSLAPGSLGEVEVLGPPRDLGLDPAGLSVARHLSFPSAGGRTAHAWFYPPASATTVAPDGELPPLVTMVHGGPTAAASPAFSLAKQYWTSRGFAVVDVDYGGSTGYGRGYRRLLDDSWGIVDVEDVCAAVRHLVEQGLVDPQRLAIRGGSAGGFTTLAALATTSVFAAGASHYGVADLSALARDTHKFESRYLDGLVGPWPQAAAVYAERSPLSHVDGFDAPLLVLQGLEDAVVPPAQAEAIVAALAAKQVPHAYLAFPGEQHGFRQAANIVRAIEAELTFYGRVFGFVPAGDLPPLDVAFARGLPSPRGAGAGQSH